MGQSKVYPRELGNNKVNTKTSNRMNDSGSGGNGWMEKSQLGQ